MSRPFARRFGGPGRVAGVTDDGVTSRTGPATNGDTVDVLTLEDLMDRHHVATVDLLKLDCEGAEWEILPAAARVLPRIRQIAMEFHEERGWTVAGLAGWLRDQGFDVAHTPGGWNGLLWATRGTSIAGRSPRVTADHSRGVSSHDMS